MSSRCWRSPWTRSATCRDDVGLAPTAWSSQRCTHAIYEHWCGDPAHPNCQDRLSAAIAEFGLSPDRTHDTLNIFQKVGVEEDGSLFIENSDARRGDFVEFRAEMNRVVNVCPADAAGGAIPAAVNDGEPKPLEVRIDAGDG